MQLGSPEHKAQFLQDLIEAFYENIWKDEIQLLEFDKLLGNLRTQKADADLKLERKEFSLIGAVCLGVRSSAGLAVPPMKGSALQ